MSFRNGVVLYLPELPDVGPHGDSEVNFRDWLKLVDWLVVVLVGSKALKSNNKSWIYQL